LRTLIGLANPPRGAKPCTEPTEKLIINALLTNLAEKQKLNINCDPTTNRTSPPTYSTKECLELVLIGGSHTARIHSMMLESGIRVAFLEVPNYMTSKVHAGKIQDGLKNLIIGPDTVLMIQVFDSGLYMAAPEEGGLIPNCKRVDGSYHMDGDLVLLSKDMQYDLFKQLDSELQNYKMHPIIFMAPLPRYLEKGCCQDQDHMKNRFEPDFAKKLEEGVFDVRKNIKNLAFRHGFRRCVTLSAWGKVRKMESLWSDGVHLLDEGYKKLVESILEAREELKVKRTGDKLEETPASKKPRADAGAAPAPKLREQSAGTRGQQGQRGQHYTRGWEGGRGGRQFTDGYHHGSHPGQGWYARATRGGKWRPAWRPDAWICRLWQGRPLLLIFFLLRLLYNFLSTYVMYL
jgi:hypothetical protein